MNGEDMDRRMHWLQLARELGQEDDFRALMDDLRREGWDRGYKQGEYDHCDYPEGNCPTATVNPYLPAEESQRP